MSTPTATDFLSATEQALAAKNPVVFVTCNPCQDFRTDVSFGVEHPCVREQWLHERAGRRLADAVGAVDPYDHVRRC